MMPNTPRIPPNWPTTPRRVEILAYRDVQVLDVTGPLQVFASANDYARFAGLPPPYAPVVVGEGGVVACSAGLELVAAPLPWGEPMADTLLIPGGFGVNVASEDERLLAWVRQRAGQARRVASVCSGAFVLARLGLLDGRRAATHWARCAELAARFPRVRVEPDPVFIEDGGIWTSAGVTAGIDLALALLEADLGGPVALAVARQLVVFLKRPGGQAQFSATLAQQARDASAGAGRFDALHAWMADHLAEPLDTATLAAAAGMSARSLLRHYRQATGSTPGRTVERLRVEAARRLLEQGTAVKRTAQRCGLGSEESLRRLFLRHLGVSPQAYRERFGSCPAAAAEV